MSARKRCHLRHGSPWVGQGDVVSEHEKAGDSRALALLIQLTKWPGQMASRSECGRPVGSVVPVRRCREEKTLKAKADKELLDQQPIIEYKRRKRHVLLIGDIRVIKRQQSCLVAFAQHTMKLRTGAGKTSRNDQSSVPEVDEPDLSTLINAPPMSKFGGKAGLATV